MTTDLLSRIVYALFMIGTPRYLSVFLRSMICSIAVLAATNSEPYVAVSTVACLFENQSVGVVLTKCNTAVTDFLLLSHGVISIQECGGDYPFS